MTDHLLAKRAQWHRDFAALPRPLARYRMHVVGLPPTAVCKSPAHPCDTLTFAIRGIVRILMSLGHEVYLYASEDSDVDCTELVVCNTVADRERWYGRPGEGAYAAGMYAPEMRGDAAPYVSFNRRVVGELDRRLEPRDFILVQGGLAQKAVADAYPQHKTVEWLIGYDGSFADFRVFQTYTHMMYTYGMCGLGTGRDWDDAGYGFYYDPADLPLVGQKGDYYLFMARVYGNKGPHIAGQVCKHLGAKLVVAGQGAKQVGPDLVVCDDGTRIEAPGVEYVGVVGGAGKAKLLGGAKAIFCPTQFREPGCSVAMEATMCGTPVIASDHSAFVEIMIPGFNGYRCRSFAQYVEAAQRVADLDRKAISERAVALYSESVLAEAYHLYFTRLYSLWGKGWYEMVAT